MFDATAIQDAFLAKQGRNPPSIPVPWLLFALALLAALSGVFAATLVATLWDVPPLRMVVSAPTCVSVGAATDSLTGAESQK